MPLAFLVCYDSKACWIRPIDGKSSGEIDASIVATHMMLEMAALGLGSIWVMSWNPEMMKKEFRLAESVEPVALLIAGYRAQDEKPRRGHLESRTMDEILIDKREGSSC